MSKCALLKLFKLSMQSIFILRCPPHEMKNLINSLESKTKTFMFDSSKSIDWKFIYAAFYRELERAKSGSIRQVPKLTVDAMSRNSWSKMDVGLAKVFIHGELAAEMTSHMITEGKYDAEKTVEFLEHLESVFCWVFLNANYRIYNSDNVCFEQLAAADNFFLRWRHNVEVMAIDKQLSASEKSKLFLSWQTYDYGE
eukprot:Pompholyxophrys_punicea_v1_NODE_430_length_1986_cov_6.927536.p2 type:complete len:197 gc:universal NODE_430_length_1986_cov_6.927536:970-380(-)